MSGNSERSDGKTKEDWKKEANQTPVDGLFEEESLIQQEEIDSESQEGGEVIDFAETRDRILGLDSIPENANIELPSPEGELHSVESEIEESEEEKEDKVARFFMEEASVHDDEDETVEMKENSEVWAPFKEDDEDEKAPLGDDGSTAVLLGTDSEALEIEKKLKSAQKPKVSDSKLFGTNWHDPDTLQEVTIEDYYWTKQFRQESNRFKTEIGDWGSDWKQLGELDTEEVDAAKEIHATSNRTWATRLAILGLMAGVIGGEAYLLSENTTAGETVNDQVAQAKKARAEAKAAKIAEYQAQRAKEAESRRVASIARTLMAEQYHLDSNMFMDIQNLVYSANNVAPVDYTQIQRAKDVKPVEVKKETVKKMATPSVKKVENAPVVSSDNASTIYDLAMNLATQKGVDNPEKTASEVTNKLLVENLTFSEADVNRNASAKYAIDTYLTKWTGYDAIIEVGGKTLGEFLDNVESKFGKNVMLLVKNSLLSTQNSKLVKKETKLDLKKAEKEILDLLPTVIVEAPESEETKSTEQELKESKGETKQKIAPPSPVQRPTLWFDESFGTSKTIEKKKTSFFERAKSWVGGLFGNKKVEKIVQNPVQNVSRPVEITAEDNALFFNATTSPKPSTSRAVEFTAEDDAFFAQGDLESELNTLPEAKALNAKNVEDDFFNSANQAAERAAEAADKRKKKKKGLWGKVKSFFGR